MPKQDTTGPAGAGPRTGRGFGPCAQPDGRQGFGFGWRKRLGMGRGMGRCLPWRWPQSQEEQKKALVDYRKALEEELEDVKKKEGDLDKAE